MTIYIVTTGEYEWNCNEFASTSYEETLKHILTLPYHDMWNSFTSLEIWIDGKFEYEYTRYEPNIISTYEQLDKDIQKYIKFKDDKLKESNNERT